MKKGKKIIIILLAVVLIIATAVFTTYEFYVEPILETKVEKVAEKINDGSVQKVVDSVAQEMIADGVIAPESIPTYSQYAQEQITPDDEVVQTVSPTPAPAPKPNKKKSLMERLKEAMTADEFAFAMSMYRRIDVSYGMQLMKTDRAAAKEYVYSKASPSEISRALEIYAKYSYILRE